MPIPTHPHLPATAATAATAAAAAAAATAPHRPVGRKVLMGLDAFFRPDQVIDKQLNAANELTSLGWEFSSLSGDFEGFVSAFVALAALAALTAIAATPTP